MSTYSRIIDRTAKRIIATDKYRFALGDRLTTLRESLDELVNTLEGLESQYNIQLPIKNEITDNYNELDNAINVFIEQNHKALRDFVVQKPRRK